MDDKDDGYFHYDASCPPMFFKLGDMKPDENRVVMQQAVMQYLRSSAQHGLKQHNALMDSGLTPGEAAVLHFRHLKEEQNEETVLPLIDLVRECVKKHMGFDPLDFRDAFVNNMLGVGEDNADQKLLCGLKAFLKDINKKPKGYTYILKHIVQDVREARKKVVKKLQNP